MSGPEAQGAFPGPQVANPFLEPQAQQLAFQGQAQVVPQATLMSTLTPLVIAAAEHNLGAFQPASGNIGPTTTGVFPPRSRLLHVL